MFSLVYTLRNTRGKGARNILWLFCIFYGFTLVINSEGADSYVYAERFIEIGKADLSLSSFTNYLYSEETNMLDIVEPLVSFILSRFTSDQRILFAVYGLIFGFFYSRNLFYLLDKVPVKKPLIIQLFIVAFALLCPIWSINGFRFWTAAQIFLFGVMPFLMEGKKKGILIASLAIFVHFSFALPMMVLLLYALVGNKRRLFFILFVVTSFIQAIDLAGLKETLTVIPELFQSKVNGYISEDVQSSGEELIAATNWYVQYNYLFIKVVVYVFLIVIYIQNSRRIRNDKGLTNLFCFSLLYYSFSNLAALVPDGIRFFTIGNMLIFFLIIMYITFIENNKLIQSFKIMAIPLLVVIILVSLRRGFDFTGILCVTGNPLFAPFVELDFPLINLLK